MSERYYICDVCDKSCSSVDGICDNCLDEYTGFNNRIKELEARLKAYEEGISPKEAGHDKTYLTYDLGEPHLTRLDEGKWVYFDENGANPYEPDCLYPLPKQKGSEE